jgi:hypothetical protein
MSCRQGLAVFNGRHFRPHRCFPTDTNDYLAGGERARLEMSVGTRRQLQLRRRTLGCVVVRRTAAGQHRCGCKNRDQKEGAPHISEDTPQREGHVTQRGASSVLARPRRDPVPTHGAYGSHLPWTAQGSPTLILRAKTLETANPAALFAVSLKTEDAAESARRRF